MFSHEANNDGSQSAEYLRTLKDGIFSNMKGKIRFKAVEFPLIDNERSHWIMKEVIGNTIVVVYSSLKSL